MGQSGMGAGYGYGCNLGIYGGGIFGSEGVHMSYFLMLFYSFIITIEATIDKS